LRSAIESAAKVQVEAIEARNRAIAQLGESVVAQYLPPIAFLGLLILGARIALISVRATAVAGLSDDEQLIVLLLAAGRLE
jgi:NADH:ubiquinone oxidoreductase subunit 6 (subunit J)